MSLYFDPGPLLAEDRSGFYGKWEERKWLNVPGPFYGAETDNCGTGRLMAPRHVLYESEYFTEYVYRQPRDAEEVRQLVDAAGEDPFGGYGCDGDDHWTPAAVRDWWRDRNRVLEHLRLGRAAWEEDDLRHGQGVAEAALDYAAYIEGELAQHLRVYMFWLEERRSPDPGNPLPRL
ncbi:ferredoxin [Streptomyces sp. NPDC002734]|uniref:ferredoxin n=1 Tax=Streptomyces sp. NPDC002734 TaxID=3154426 RepID=UPI00331B39E8